MKHLKYYLYLCVFFLFASCSDDDTGTNPSHSDLNGSWAGTVILGDDSSSYSCVITESSGNVAGTADLYVYHYEFNGGTSKTEEIRRKGTIHGTFASSEVKIYFLADTSNYFTGTLSEDKTKITGQIKAYLPLTEFHASFDVILNKVNNIK